MREELNHFLDGVNSRQMVHILSWIVGTALAVIVIVYAVYFAQFHGKAGDQAVYGQFGDFIGGTLNPVLSFLSLIALIFTVVLQTRQLEHSREELLNSKKELAATRHEMERATRVQRAMSRAAHDQSRYANISTRLAALQAALAVASEDLENVRNTNTPDTQEMANTIWKKKEDLSLEILRITNQLLAAERRAEPRGHEDKDDKEAS